MTTKFKQPGKVLDYVAGANIASGDGLVIGAWVGVALADIANGAVGPVQIEGVFTLKKKSTDTFAAGAIAYWDATNKEITSTSSGNTAAGHAFNAAGSGATVIDIKLNA